MARRYTIVRQALLVAALLPFAGAAMAQEAAPEPPLRELPEAQWPPEFPSLEVIVTPEAPDGDAPDKGRPTLLPGTPDVPFDGGGGASLLDILSRAFVHDENWTPFAELAARSAILRPDLSEPAGRRALVERADLATIMGGGFLGMTAAQIYVHFGFLPDGTRPEVAAYGIESPTAGISPTANCFGGAGKCTPNLLSNPAPKLPIPEGRQP